ncbi:MAG: CoA-binding protein [Chitinophagales bacterium]
MNEQRKTLVLGASPNPERYSYLAVQKLRRYGHSVIAVGGKEGKIADIEIRKDFPDEKEIDTITMYLNPMRQQQYYDQIILAKPKRIIFNPGAENPELEELALKNNIETIEACTLVMLSTGQY